MFLKNKKEKIAFISLGCDKNRIDLEIMMAKIQSAGYAICEDIETADAVIINSCGFIDASKQETIDEILSAAYYKEHASLKKIIVTGCLAQRYQDEILKELPEVDCVVGLGSNENIVSILDKCLKKDESFATYGSKTDLPLDGDRLLSTPFYTAYLKIAEGCSNFCTYCAIPMIRGKYRSRSRESILNEAKTLAKTGVVDLNIVAQDPTLYGKDLYGKLMLASLLEDLCKIDGIRWIRLLYCYPDRINDELLDVINREEKIVKYLDIPLQHCVGKILKKMNRFGDEESLSKLIEKIRKKVPGISLRTTLLLAFPGESEEDFENLCSFVKNMQFEKLGCFAYSAEENTKAATFDNQLNSEVKELRLHRMYEIQYNIMQTKLKQSVGKTVTVLCEGFDEHNDMFFGRRSVDAPEVDNKLYFSCGSKVTYGQFVDVKITDVLDYDLLGEAL